MAKLFLLGIALTVAWGFAAAQTREEIVNNNGGYKVERAPTYIIMTPRRVRPSQVLQVFCTILRLEYGTINLRVSIIKDKTEFTEGVLKFEQPGSRILQMLMPANAQQGHYKVKAEGILEGGNGGYAFYNETDIEFDAKQASCFIQLSKPIYRQGQTVHFRVIPILPDMMPVYGSLTIYVNDPTGFAVRRWLGLQTNAGGFVSQNFTLSDQPNYGNWSIQVDAYGYQYKKYFQVEEYWDPRFDLNVTTSPYVMDNMDYVRGTVMANITTGKPVMGSARVRLTVIPPAKGQWLQFFNTLNRNRGLWDYSPYPYLERDYDYFKGRIDFAFSREEIFNAVRQKIPYAQNLIDLECMFNVTAKDWFFNMTQSGFASTIIFDPNVKLVFIGDHVRTFKPDSIMTIYVAAMYHDGTPVRQMKRIQITKRFEYITGGPIGAENQPEEKMPVDGVASFDIPIAPGTRAVDVSAKWDYDTRTTITLRATRYYSPSESYIAVRTSTEHPKINEFMIFHVKTSHFVPKIYYQIVSQGNILIGDEIEMVSRHKTFAVALSRQMVPTARIVVYYLQTSPEEMVVDTLNFFVNGTRSNPVSAVINKGKDFTLHTVEINALAEPGSYVAFAAIPNDLYSKGMNDGLTENNLIDELVSYDEPSRGSYKQLWRLSDTEYEYKFYSSTGYGIDANSTFRHAGLLVLSDANIHAVPELCNWELGERPCFSGECYHVNKTCDGIKDCPTDWADEQGCIVEDPRYVDNRTMNMIYRVNRNLRFYEDSGFAWQERFVKPDGMVQFRIEPPKFPLTWIINAMSVSREKGLGLMQTPIRYDATRYMYIIVEAPDLVIRGEQIGVRVSVFNYWYKDDYLEVLITMKDGDNYKFVWVDEMGITSAYAPLTTSGDHQTIVFLEPGESKDIFLPIVSTLVQGYIDFTVHAVCFMERDYVTKRVRIMPDGVLNYFHTPYLVDMIKYGSETIPQLQINIPDQFVVPEVRQHLYVPGSGVAEVSLFGDVVTPGFFKKYMNCEDIFRKPYGAGEMNMFNFAYNLLTLKFKKANQQLPPDTLSTALHYLNIGLQRQLSYMNKDGSFKMFRDDVNTTSIWLSAFVAKTLHEARFGEWERDLFIPIDLIDKIVVWLCSKQNETGAWYPEGEIYDRKFSSQQDNLNQKMYGHPVPLTAYVLIALYKIETDVSGAALSCIDKSRQLAAEYLSREVYNTPNREVFHLAISAYALSLSQQKSRSIFDKLWSLRNQSNEIYFSDSAMPENPSDFINTVRYLLPRVELMNDGYAVQSTAYALMAHIKHNGRGIESDTKIQRDSMMRWLNYMRNFIGGFASTQDTLAAMEALFEFTLVDPNRNVFDIMLQMETSSTPDWVRTVSMTRSNYTNMVSNYVPQDYTFGSIRVTAQGVGRSMMQLTTTVNVEYGFLLKETQDQIQFFELTSDYTRFTGRNESVLLMTPCVRWVYLEKSQQSGLTVLEIDIPTGYVIMNHTLRDYVQNGGVPNLKRAEFYYRKVVFYFTHIDNSRTCVNVRADRWYPTANMTIQHRMKVYDYYEPGMHNTTFYSTYSLFNLNICYVCGSYQCPYCPFFNVGTIIKASFTCIALILGFLLQRYNMRTS
ncbi:endopeptidase inhibitor [Mactra antiquata]